MKRHGAAGVALLCAAAALAACTETFPVTTPVWQPGVIYGAPGAPRGLREARGIIHAHSVYSHDACDDEPVKNGERDPICFDHLRQGLCASRHDFVMLTDHPSDFSDIPFPEVLLFVAERGDELVVRNDIPVANRLRCEDGRQVLVTAGTESSDVMPVGLEGHVEPSLRSLAYGSSTVEALAALAAVGSVVLVAHTESRSTEYLTTNAIAGFEMFNLHANALRNAVDVLQLIVLMDRGSGLPVPDAILTPMLDEDPRYTERWGDVLATGAKRVTTMGTDCHENTFPGLLSDGERIDSYRRMMIAFSNHLLVRPRIDGTYDDVELKEALAAGRLYGAFEAFGYPVGFDFRAEVGATVAEMGDEVLLTDAPQLSAVMPRILDLDPAAPAPELRLRLLRAVAGGWEEVAAGTTDLSHTPSEVGAYRVQVDIVPRHMTAYVGDFAESVAAVSQPWIYSNPIYVR